MECSEAELAALSFANELMSGDANPLSERSTPRIDDLALSDDTVMAAALEASRQEVRLPVFEDVETLQEIIGNGESPQNALAFFESTSPVGQWGHDLAETYATLHAIEAEEGTPAAQRLTVRAHYLAALQHYILQAADTDNEAPLTYTCQKEWPAYFELWQEVEKLRTKDTASLLTQEILQRMPPALQPYFQPYFTIGTHQTSDNDDTLLREMTLVLTTFIQRGQTDEVVEALEASSRTFLADPRRVSPPSVFQAILELQKQDLQTGADEVQETTQETGKATKGQRIKGKRKWTANPESQAGPAPKKPGTQT